MKFVEEAKGRENSRQASAILLIDDDDVLRGLAAEFLSEAGYKVYEAPSAEEAFDLFSVNSQEIALVITDMGLPGMGGGELLLKIREVKPEVKAVAISGFGGEDMLRQIRASSAEMFIPKPFTREDLLKVVGSFLNLR